MNLKSLFLIFVYAFLLCACSTGARLDAIQRDYSTGDYKNLVTDKSSRNLELLIGAQAAFQSGEYEQSDELFESFNRRNINPISSSIATEAGKIIAGQTAVDYKPYMMDYLFVSYYQLWDALLGKRTDDARVIINQSYSRQQKMSREYENMIKNRQSIPDSIQADVSHWATYSDIMNPALTYLAGLYFLNIGENENARQYLERAHGMVQTNKYISQDLDMARKNITPNNTAWIFIETGFAPRLREKKLNIPWPTGDKIQVVSIATSYPEIYNGLSKYPTDAQILSDVDAMFITEYKEYQINDGARAFAKAIANASLQSSTKNNRLSGLASIIYSVATTNAETRTWVTLPQRIYLLRYPKNKSGLIKLDSGVMLEVEYSGNHVIHIRNGDIKVAKIK